MEQKEKNEKPRWVVILERDYKPIVHQMVGNLCANMIQTCLNLYGMNEDLFIACMDEVDALVKKDIEADAKAVADSLVKDVSK